MISSWIAAARAASTTLSMGVCGLPSRMLSATEIPSSWRSCSTVPTVARRTDSSISRTSTPPMLIEPESASRKRASSAARVDLPEPEGPTTAVTLPAGTLRQMSCRAMASESSSP